MKTTIEETGDGILLRPALRFPETSIQEVADCLRSKGKSQRHKRKTRGQMDDAIAREVGRRHDSGRY
jgi:hypothetical protein